MIKTKYDTILHIDDTAYKVVVKELNKQEKKEVIENGKEIDKAREKLTKKQLLLARAEKKYELNERILGSSTDESVLKEQKALFEKMCKLSDEIDKIQEECLSEEEVQEKIIKDGLARRLEGDDAKAFLDRCLELGVPLFRIRDELDEAIQKAKEKK